MSETALAARCRNRLRPLACRVRRWSVLLNRHRGPSGPRRLWILGIGACTLVVWQLSFAAPALLDAKYHVFASTGLHANEHFVFFYRHLGLYPIATRAPILADTPAEAQRHLREHGQDLVMDENWTFRSGDRGRTWLYFVDSFLQGRTTNLSTRPATILAWLAVLIALFGAFWHARRPLFGAIVIWFFGSNPFVLFEVYANPNIFGWVFVAAAVLIALHVSLIFRGAPRGREAWLLPLLAALTLATVRTIRSEPTPLLLSVALLYATLARVPLRTRWIMIAGLIAAFLAFSVGYSQYFRWKFNDASRIVVAAGGSAYTGPYESFHELWHPIWCGLSDFDRKYGYVWDDREAYRYALPIMHERYRVEIPSFDVSYSFFPDASYDAGGRYPKLASELPFYTEVIRGKILSDIRRDPAWYFGILARRVNRVLFDNAPVRIAWGRSSASLAPSWGGWLLLVIPGLLLILRQWPLLRLTLFTSPLWAAPVFIFSDRGMAYYASTSHSLAVAVVAASLGVIAVRSVKAAFRSSVRGAERAPPSGSAERERRHRV